MNTGLIRYYGTDVDIHNVPKSSNVVDVIDVDYIMGVLENGQGVHFEPTQGCFFGISDEYGYYNYINEIDYQYGDIFCRVDYTTEENEKLLKHLIKCFNRESAFDLEGIEARKS